MFDPHKLRRNDSRFFTRKGQVIQAKNLNAPFTIEENKVNAYKEYIVKNHLVPPTPLRITAIKFDKIGTPVIVPIRDLTPPISSAYLHELQGGPKVIILVRNQTAFYSFTFKFSTDNSYNVAANTWFAYVIIPEGINSIDCVFQSDGQDIFDCELNPSNNLSNNAYPSLYKTQYIVPLPAPSE